MLTVANLVRVVLVVAVVVYAAPYLKTVAKGSLAPLKAVGKLEKSIR